MSEKYLLLLDYSRGIIKPIPLTPEELTNDRIVIVIDELNECVWIWRGSSTSMIESRAAERKARSITSIGFHMPGSGLKIGGPTVSRIEIVNGQTLDDPETKQTYDLLMFTLSQQFVIQDEKLGGFTGAFIPPASLPSAPLPGEAASAPLPSEVVPSASPNPETAQPVAATPVSSVESSTPSSSTSPTSTEAVESSSPAPSGDLSVVRVGILISSVLEFFSSVFCAIKRGEDSVLYSIEDSDGILCEVEVKGGSIRFLQSYNFRGKREDILALLQKRLASAGL